MNNRDAIDKKIEEAINSFDGAGRATPSPFLLTRINARMNRESENAWGKLGSLILRPAYVVAGLILIIGINAMVILYKGSSTTDVTNTSEQMANASDDYVTKTATLYDIENTAP